MTDRTEIVDLFARLAHLLDDKDWEAARAIYTKDIVVHSPRAELHGIDELVNYLRESEIEGEHYQHMNTDVLVEVDGDRARASANQLVHFYRDGEPPHRISGLRLAYRAVRTPAGWRFSEAQIKLAWQRSNQP